MLREVHAPQQILEARVGAQGVVPTVHLEKDQPVPVFGICSFKPFQRLIALTKGGIDWRNETGRDVFVLCSLCEIIAMA